MEMLNKLIKDIKILIRLEINIFFKGLNNKDRDKNNK